MSQSKVTKLELIEHQFNDKCNNFYFHAHCRVFRDDRKMYYKCSFIVWIDSEDVLCWLDDLNGKNQTFTMNDVRKCAREWAENYLFSNAPEKYEDRKARKEFIAECHETIDRWNARHGWY